MVKKKKSIIKGNIPINPKTGKKWKLGDVREDGLILYRFHSNKINKNGFYLMYFKEKKYIIKDTIKKILSRNPNNLSLGYLLNIFPKDFKCPILRKEFQLSLGFGHSRNPYAFSLDKIVPSKGYKKGNVIFISLLANQIKTNATSSEILAVGKWLQKNMKKKELSHK